MLTLTLAVVVVAALWSLPALLTRHPSRGLSAAERLKATNDVRGTLVQAFAGLALLGGLFFTARTFRLGVKNSDLALQEQLTDRYTKAVEQLGSDKLDVRLGGIYALERLMVDSARDHPTIVEVLAAFLREHAKWPIDAPPLSTPERIPMPPDTAAVTCVIARRSRGREERGPLVIRDCYLIGADLFGADLAGADLAGTFLAMANLDGADLSRAYLDGANLSGANLSFAALIHADLSGAELSGADLSGAKLWHVSDLTRWQSSVADTIASAQLPDYLVSDQC